MLKKQTSTQKLIAENKDLRARLDEAEEIQRAIRSGAVDALVVSGAGGEQIFTSKSADHSFRILIEEMNEGALTLTAEGVVLYANRRFAEMIKTPLEKVIGSTIHNWIMPDKQWNLQSMLSQGIGEKHREQFVLSAGDGTEVPVSLSASKLPIDEIPGSFCLVAIDLTEQKRSDALVSSEKLARELLAASNQSRLELLSMIEKQKQTELALRNKQLMLTRTEDIAHIGSWEWDIAKDRVTWSDELFCIFQRDPREGAPSFAEHSAIYPPEDMARLQQAVEVAVAEGTSYELELRAIRKGGETRMCVARGVAEKAPGGSPVRLFGSLQDITDRKWAEEELRRTLESLRKSFAATIQVMVSAVEARDPYTSGHQTRSADLACAIATEMGLPSEKIEGIRMVGSIHDIGKLSIPAEILSKPAKLSELEFSLIKEHSKKGYEMLKDVESPWPLAEIVRQHHERMDGSGYPQKLKGEDILMEARILAVADVVEAMASHRPYRPSLGIHAALDEIEKNRGTLYDKTVADACLRLFREKGYSLNN